ncbi:MAG TPA: FkbM family methyltransferase [Gemmatimonadaceae bacterium]
MGAHTGEEREIYHGHGLRVVWIEADPDAFEVLRRNLVEFPEQRAIRCLVTDRDDAEYAFHIANNDGASSSILELHYHRDIWPTVAFERTIQVRSATLPVVLAREGIDPTAYDALIMDTQGSELMVLEGARSILKTFRYIKTEVPDFESYSGCCQLHDIADFMKRNGFRELSRHKFAERAEGGSYYDVVYERLS